MGIKAGWVQLRDATWLWVFQPPHWATKGQLNNPEHNHSPGLLQTVAIVEPIGIYPKNVWLSIGNCHSHPDTNNGKNIIGWVVHILTLLIMRKPIKPISVRDKPTLELYIDSSRVILECKNTRSLTT
ncbi:uncharacterized protein G2W53_022268 [Senna tora]|uniref:Uncharacterized protein n=1 Tax=Senna tora TaxID=362788 RepID=A0A834TMP7_9FABA|nr:uncharacterized protein G2W53_022268 [Senna tora]